MKNKRIVLTLLVILVIIGLTTVGLKFLKRSDKVSKTPELANRDYNHYPFPDPPNKIYPVTKKRCENQVDQESKDKCLAKLAYQNAIISQNPDNCLALTDDHKRDYCLFTIAKTQFKAEICEQIKKDRTKELCLIEVGIVSSNDKVCDEYFMGTPFLRKKCKDKIRVFDIIRNKKDIRLCQEIRLLEYGPLCYSYLLQEGQSCDVIEDEKEKEVCQCKMIITKNPSKEDCQRIISENCKKVCLIMVQNDGDLSIDSDGDGKSNLEELNYRLDPFNPDTDGDGLMDGEEIVKYHSDPKSVDTDIDGLDDYDEVFIYKTDINNPDTDGDGYQDGEEVRNGYNPLGEGRL